MQLLRNFNVIFVAVMAMILLSLALVAAQDAPPVMILPVDGANFLPGAYFDVRVEVHASELPEDFAVSINGEDVLEGAELSSWTAEESLIGVEAQAATWRGLSFDEPGEYLMEVTAGGESHSATWTVRDVTDAGAMNVILFIADGGSVAVNTASRLVSRGMVNGYYNDRLSFEKWEELGLVSTSGLDSIITDSANSASAYNTGHKSAVNATGVYPDTSVDAHDDPAVETFAEILRRVTGKSIGIVSNAEYVDATPAAAWGHGRQRNNATRADYALQLVGDGTMADRLMGGVMPEVIFGGGSAYLLPQSTDGSRRGDDVDVVALYEEAGYTVVETASEMMEAVDGGAEMLAGFFHPGNMNVWLDRNVYTDNLGDFTDQPGLEDMTLAALEILSQNDEGFYLYVEGSSIDKQLHPMDMERGISDMIELDRTIAATIEFLESNGMMENTLLIFTADHGHSFDVFGTVDVEAFNAGADDIAKRDAIGIYAQAGYPTYVDEDGDFFPDSWDVSRTLAWGKVENPPFTEDYQVSIVPRTPSIRDENGVEIPNPEDDPNGIPLGGNLPNGAGSSVHTLQDVPVWAQGPGSAHLGGSMENLEIFFAMANAIGLDPRG